MAGLWYRAGTISVTNASKKVVGSGTLFKTTTFKPDKGHAFYGPDGKPYEIDYVESDTVLYLVKAYTGATASGQSYEIDITRTSTIPALSREISGQLAYAQGQYDSWQQILTGSGNVTLVAPDGQTISVPALANMLSKSGNLAGLADKATSRRNLGISAFSDTILDDANAVAMRSTLGAAGVAATNSWSAEQKFSGDGAYADPDNGVGRAVKIGAKGLAVLGGIKSDTLTVAARPSWAGFTPLDSNNFPVEAGTFTPIIEGTVAGACTYSLQIGRYRRVGNLVTIWARVAWTGHTGTGRMDLKGLPFIPNATTNHIQIAQVTANAAMSIFQNGVPVGHSYPTVGAKIRIGKFDTATGVRGDVNVAAVGELWVTMTYEI